MLRLLKKTWLVLLFVAVNLGIAATPASAIGWDNDTCTDAEGTLTQCCTWCLWFCECDILLR